MTFEPFDTVLLLYPFADMPVAQARPAVILTSHAGYTAHSGVAVAAMITSSFRLSWPHDCVIADLETPGLWKPSLIRMKLMTVDIRLIERPLGTLGDTDRDALRAAVRNVLGGVL